MPPCSHVSISTCGSCCQRLLRNWLQNQPLLNLPSRYVAVSLFPCMMISSCRPSWPENVSQELLFDKQILAPSPFYSEAVQCSLIPLPLPCSHSLLHVLASATTNRLIDPKWNTELINTVLMRVCCSVTCHLNHLSSGPEGHPVSVIRCMSHQFALSFWEEYAIIINISRCSICQAQSGCEISFFFNLLCCFFFNLQVKIAAFLSPVILTIAYS